jgi:Myo-inositol oxygenase
MTSTPAKKPRYTQQVDERQRRQEGRVSLPSPPSKNEQEDGGDDDEDDGAKGSSLVDLFQRRMNDANQAEPTSVISRKFPDRSPCRHEWYTQSGRVCTLRIETRRDDCCENDQAGIDADAGNYDEGQERILLFRSDRRGAIGKIIFSYHRVAGRRNDALCGSGGGDDDDDGAAQSTTRAKIQVVDVKDGAFVFVVGGQLCGGGRDDASHLLVLFPSCRTAYRGFDLGGLLVSLAVERLGRRLCRRDSCRQRRDAANTATDNDAGCSKCSECSGGVQTISIFLDAEEDSRRHNRLVGFYRRLGFDARDNVKVSYLNNNDGETIRKVPMQRVICRDACSHQGLLLPLLTDAGAALLPVSFACDDSGTLISAASQDSPFRNPGNWLLVSNHDHEGSVCFISTTGRALALSDLGCSRPASHSESSILEPLWFLLRRIDKAPEDDDDATHFWILETRGQPNRYLACDPYRRRLVLSTRPILWCCDPDNLQLVCWSDDTPALHEQYRRSWTIQTVPFVQRMRERYLSFTLRPMTLLQALQLAASVQADPFSKRRDLPSLRALCLATAKLAHDLDQPDWVLVVALVYHLGRLVRTFEDHDGSPSDGYDLNFDWTPAIESRVVGYPAPPSAKFYELRSSIDEELDMEECCGNGADQRWGDSSGLDQARLTFTGPEYVYHWLRHNGAHLPDEGLRMVRLASLVDWHSRGAYHHLACTSDVDAMPFVVEFHEIVRRAWWETASLLPSKEASDEDDFDFLWSTRYADLASKYGLDGVLMW